MKTFAVLATSAFGVLYASSLWSQSTGPGDRMISDPLAIESPSNPAAAAIPIDDL